MTPGLVRLSLRPAGGTGEPYGDDTVAVARELVEGTCLSQRAIAARIGISQAALGVWIRSGGWHRPPGSIRPFHQRRETNDPTHRKARSRAWRLLGEAEALFEAEPGLDGLERALAKLLEARDLHVGR